MRFATLKGTAIELFRNAPDSESLSQLRSASERQIKQLLLWLDRNGLTLYLSEHLRELGAGRYLPTPMEGFLTQRLQSNRDSVNRTIIEFVRISKVLDEFGLDHIFLKGFSLVPDFCRNPYLRHFSDIDVLLPPQSVRAAVEAVGAFGYEVIGLSDTGETKLATRQTVLPSRFDSVFSPRESQLLEFHSTLWETTENVTIPLTSDFLEERTRHGFKDHDFPVLSLAGRFLLQLLHAFHHFLKSSIRLAWLYEIHYFLQTQRPLGFWQDVRRYAGPSQKVRNACGLILNLVHTLFETQLPQELEQWCTSPLPLELKVWAETVGKAWMLCDAQTNKSTLLIHRYFLDDPTLWKGYVQAKLLPLSRIRSAPGATRDIQATTRDTAYVIWKGRLSSRFRTVTSYPIDFLRFTIALRNRRATLAD